jgi:hypothetical protein
MMNSRQFIFGVVIVLAAVGIVAAVAAADKSLELTLTSSQQQALKGKSGSVEITLTDKQLKEIKAEFPDFTATIMKVDVAHVISGDKVKVQRKGGSLLSISSEPVYKPK